MKLFKKLTLAVVALALSHSAFAWNSFGHEAIAYVAEQHLTPKAKDMCRQYLGHTLPYYASWMDHWRAVPPFVETNLWHGIRVLQDGTMEWSPKGNGKAMMQLDRIMKEMKNYKELPDSLVRQNLLILVHMVADMHCPVHVGFPRKYYPQFRFSLYNGNKSVKTHGFWDASPGFTRKKWTYEEYAAEVDNISKKQARAYCKGSLQSWGDDIVQRAMKAYSILPANTDISRLTSEQRQQVLDYADEMAMMAAHRLAYVLNTIFKK